MKCTAYTHCHAQIKACDCIFQMDSELSSCYEVFLFIVRESHMLMHIQWF